MTNKNFKGFLSLCLVFALITAMALTMVSCDKNTDTTEATKGTLPTEAEKGTLPTEGEVPQALGTFTLTVTFADGSEQVKDYSFYEEGDLGKFLVENGIAEGEDGRYGLYIKSVLGEAHDYEVDQTYWAFYIDGEMAMTGVSDTALTDGANYALKATK